MGQVSPTCPAIVFDFDGVLVESVEVKTRAFEALYAPYGEDVRKAVVSYHLAHGGVSRNEKFRYFHSALLARDLSPEEEVRLAERFSELVEDAVVAAPFVPGAHDFLEAHAGRIPLCVASGTPEEELLRIIRRRGMSGYFCAVGGSPRPKRELLEDFAKRLDVAAASLLMVGDAMTDFDAAHAVGARFLGRVPVGEISPFPPGTHIVSDMRSLANFLCA